MSNSQTTNSPTSNSPTTAPLRVALVGYGHMGREIERLAPHDNIAITARFDLDRPLADAAPDTFDVAIDFTRPDAVLGNVAALTAWDKPVVIGTTGWLSDLDRVESMVVERGGRIVYASNFSIGVNIFFRLTRIAARMMNEQPAYDAAVHETHHTRKADAPSGTALTAARLLLEELDRKSELLTETPQAAISPGQLHVSSQRLGNTVGTHVVSFDSEADTIEIVHRARDRSGFARGALWAARWLAAQPTGLYRFEDLFA